MHLIYNNNLTSLYNRDAKVFDIWIKQNRIGYVGIFKDEDKDFVGVHIDEEYRGKGYIKGAYKLLVKELNLNELWASIKYYNKASLRAHRKMKFKYIRLEGNDTFIFHKRYLFRTIRNWIVSWCKS